MKRNIIRNDEEKWNGCGLCIANYQESAIQIIEGQAWLLSDPFCEDIIVLS